MPYFSGLMQQTGMILSAAIQPEGTARPAAPPPESRPAFEVEEVRDANPVSQVGTLAQIGLSAASQAIQPTLTDVPPSTPPGPRAETEPDMLVYESTATRIVPPMPVPVREPAAGAPEQPTASSSPDTKASVIEVIETIEVTDTAPAPVLEAPPLQPGPRTEEAQTTPVAPLEGGATRPARPPQPQTLAQSLAEVHAWVTATPGAVVPEPTPSVHAPVVEIEQAVAAPRSDMPLPAHRSREPSAPAEVGQHFSLHIGTIQLSIEAPPQPPVDGTHPPPAGPQLTPAPAPQASRWRRRYVRL